ncbi:endonuclease/exonuclease/phosphatase family protein [Psychromonas sp. Urea-02u-13]|uniref:endonuclease/exonuclease/phosphatase family protein n=1 Tax=Psychromonas sp. Urea-02u-13 TaxID=2058326 RepID=UPI000C3281CC|nr:endonuclease/exonuclease/phosphatase family protein [Psychromonas sp. Urea-02u-13]PKG37915.1 hypothetical protein CXF74_16385 [Psychromonas sp. Urea-02u-13]
MDKLNVNVIALRSGFIWGGNALILVLLSLPFFSAQQWWLDNLSNLQWQWSLCAGLLIVINIIYRLRFYTLLSGLLVMLIINQQWFLYQPQQTSLEEAQTLNIGQFNISYTNPYFNELLPQLGESDLDVIVLQEASDKQGLNLSLLLQYYPYSLGLESLNGTPSGLALFSRWPIIESKSHQLNAEKTHILEVVIQSPKSQTPVQIYAIHPVSPRNEQLWLQRNKTFVYLSELVSESLLDNKIIIGDFNSSHWSSAFKKLQRNTALKNSAAGFGYIPSWSHGGLHGWWPMLSAYVDHCLISPQMAVLNKYQQIMPGSDHRLIKTLLAIP